MFLLVAFLLRVLNIVEELKKKITLTKFDTKRIWCTVISCIVTIYSVWWLVCVLKTSDSWLDLQQGQ
jgi:hypothetical protein